MDLLDQGKRDLSVALAGERLDDGRRLLVSATYNFRLFLYGGRFPIWIRLQQLDSIESVAIAS